MAQNCRIGDFCIVRGSRRIACEPRWSPNRGRSALVATRLEFLLLLANAICILFEGGMEAKRNAMLLAVSPGFNFNLYQEE